MTLRLNKFPGRTRSVSGPAGLRLNMCGALLGVFMCTALVSSPWAAASPSQDKIFASAVLGETANFKRDIGKLFPSQPKLRPIGAAQSQTGDREEVRPYGIKIRFNGRFAQRNQDFEYIDLDEFIFQKNTQPHRHDCHQKNINFRSPIFLSWAKETQGKVFGETSLKLYRIAQLNHNSITLLQDQFPTQWSRLMSGTSVQSSNEILVSNTAELYEALESVSSGTVIKLLSGDYGDLVLNSNNSDVGFPEGTTIVSADPEAPASFSSMMLYGVSNLTFDSIHFDYTYAEGDHPNGRPFAVRSSDSITFKNSLFEGDILEGVSEVYDGAGAGHGLNLVNSSNIVVDNNEFVDLIKGITIENSDDLVISNNEIHDLHADGMILTEVNNILIENNYIHDLKKPEGSDAHQDMIQMFSGGRGAPSTNITITGNVFDRGDGDAVQGLHFRNESVDKGQAGEEMYYQNISITDNVILPGAKNGIVIGETNGLTIENNTVLTPFGGSEDAEESVDPAVYVNNTTSTDVVIRNNIGISIPESENSDYVIENNLIVQYSDPDLPNYYDDVFVDGFAAVKNSADISDLAIAPGSGFEGYGADLQRYSETPDEPTGVIGIERGQNLDTLNVNFEASSLVGPEGPLNLDGATVSWTFGDGQVADGLSVGHSYAGSGSYGVEAVVTLASGEIVKLDKTVEVVSPVVVEMTFDEVAGAETLGLSASSLKALSSVESSTKELAEAGSDLQLETGTVNGNVSFESGAARLNDGFISIDRSSQMENNSAFSFVIDFKLDEPVNGTVRLASLLGAFQIKLQEGRVIAGLSVDGEGYPLYADADLSIGKWHKLALTYSSAAGEMKLYLNGEEIGSVADISGLVTGSNGHNLVIGDAYSGTSIDGLVDDIAFLTGALSEKQIQDFSLSDFAPVSDAGGTGGTSDPATGEAEEEDTEQDEDTSTGDPAVEDPVEDEEKDAGAAPDSDTDSAYVGTNSDDFIRGTQDAEIFYGGAGDDLIVANGGEDQAFGEAGNDTLAGSGANDRFFGGEGDDTLKGQGGDDFLDGGVGADVLKGMAGDDIIVFDDNDVYVHGGEGYDTLKVDAAYGDTHDFNKSTMKYYGIEEIDAENGTADTLIVDHKRASRSDTGVLTISGDEDDVLVFDAQAVRIVGDQMIDGELYFKVETKLFSDIADFLVDADMTIMDHDVVVAENGVVFDEFLF